MNIADNIFSIICDDVREEKGNKLSLMGVYQKEIILRRVPGLLPKIAFVIFLEGLKKKIPSGTIKAHMPGREVQELAYKGNKKSGGKNATMYFLLVPFRVNEVGQVKFELFFGNEKKPTHTKILEIKEMDVKEN